MDRQRLKREYTYQGIIEGSNKDELSIRRKLSERNRRRLIINEGLKTSPRIGIPDLAGAVVAGGDDDGSVAVEMNGRYGLGVGVGNRPDGAAGLDVPDAEAPVERAGDDEIRTRVEVDAEDEVGVAAEGLDAVSGGGEGVPDAEGAVVGGGADVVGVGGPGEVGDAVGVAGEAGAEGEGFGVPDDQGFVEGGGGEEGAVVGELHAGDGSGVVLQGVGQAIWTVGIGRWLLGPTAAVVAGH